MTLQHDDIAASTHTEAGPRSATPTTPAHALGALSNEALDREIKNMKAVVAQQSRQIAAQGQALADLTAEIKALMDKIG